MENKKRKKIILIGSIMVVLLIAVLVLNNVVMWHGMYLNNSKLDKQTNNTIKSLVISAIKDRCLSLYDINMSELYDESQSERIIQYDNEAHFNKKLFCFINMDFMDSVEKINEEEYRVIVHIVYPENRYYHIYVNLNNNGGKITAFMIDI